MKFLIVNADDLGLCEAVTTGIVEAHRQGVVTSASLMPTGRGFQSAVEQVRSLPTLDVGVHLTLVGEGPRLPRLRIPSLVDADGRFPGGYAEFLRRFLGGRIRLSDVERELRAQVETCLLAGLKPSHLDSHQHLHVLPGISRIVRRIARSYAIPGIRIPRETARRRHAKPLGRLVQRAVLSGLAMAAALRARSQEFRICDDMLGMSVSGRLSEEVLLDLLGHVGEGVTELICHPGRVDSQVRSEYGWWGYEWEQERQALVSSCVRDRLAALGISLTTYSLWTGAPATLSQRPSCSSQAALE
jgi:hopanoid biosynthesis associated protein HpnK